MRTHAWRMCSWRTADTCVHAQHLMWLPRIVLACASVGGGRERSGSGNSSVGSAELLLYPRYHLDNSSLLARYPLPQVGAPVLRGSTGDALAAF